MSNVPKHSCPWPGCSRTVTQDFWGCRSHWDMLPTVYRNNYLRAVKLGAAQATVDGIREMIMLWVSKHPKAQPLQESKATPTFPQQDFATGCTETGDLFLFWPNAQEYMVIERRHMRILLAGVRVVVNTKGGHNEKDLEQHADSVRQAF